MKNHFKFIVPLLCIAIGQQLCQSSPILRATKMPRLIVGVVSGSSYLLGAWANNQWISAKAAQKLVKGGEKYWGFEALGFRGQIMGGAAKNIGEPCEDAYEVKLSTKASLDVAVSGVPDAQKSTLRPRPVQVLQSPIYKTIVAQWLKAHSMKNPQVGTPKVWRVDLDGDGAQEVIINAVRHDGKNGLFDSIRPASKSGDYCLLLVRRVVGKSVQTIALDKQFYLTSREFNAPNIVELREVLDLNGDGRMEIVVGSRYYEGNSVSVYGWNKEKPQEILSTGCGV